MRIQNKNYGKDNELNIENHDNQHWNKLGLGLA